MATAPPRRRTGLIAVVVVVVVVVAFIGLYFAGAIPGLKPSSGASNSSVTFSTARTSADAAAQPYNSTYPNLSVVFGFGLQESLAGTPSQLSYSQNCPAVAVSGAPSTFIIPAGGSGAASGSLPFWWFVYTGSSGMLFVLVINGQATAMATEPTGSVCPAPFGTELIPKHVLDSSAIAANATSTASGGGAFLKANPQASVLFLLTGGLSVFGFGTHPMWFVEFTDCSFAASQTTPSAPSFGAIIDGVNGTVTAAAPSNSTCGGLTLPPGGTSGGGGHTLGSSLAFGAPLEAASGGHYWYNVSVQAAASGITWGDVSFAFTSASGTAIPPGTAWVANVLSITGSSVATFSFQTFSWTNASTPITSTQVLSIETTTSLNAMGDALVVYGTGSFSGEVSVAIP